MPRDNISPHNDNLESPLNLIISHTTTKIIMQSINKKRLGMTIFKIGAEFRMVENWDFRLGFSHGGQPIGEDDVLFNILAPGLIEDHGLLIEIPDGTVDPRQPDPSSCRSAVSIRWRPWRPPVRARPTPPPKSTPGHRLCD